MKNSLKLGLIALIIGVAASAFTTVNSTYKTANKAEELYWFDPSVSTYHDQNTEADERTATGCSAAGADCEKGFTSDQLKNPANPSQGVKSSEQSQPAATIAQQ